MDIKGLLETNDVREEHTFSSEAETVPDTPAKHNPSKRKRSEEKPAASSNTAVMSAATKRPSASLRFEPSFLGTTKMSGLVRVIGNFLQHYLLNDTVGVMEIEAKVGNIIDPQTNKRLVLPVLSECVLNPEFAPSVNFRSDMTQSEHKHYNDFLNTAFVNAQRPGRAPMKYKHTKEIDKFFEKASHGKVRVSRNVADNTLMACIEKRRIADLFVYCPNNHFDFRISISDEIPVPLPKDESKPSFSREKDRVGYVHQDIHIDLTQTYQKNARSGTTSKRHELEVEFGNTPKLREYAESARNGSPLAWERVLNLFVENIRILLLQTA
ncbi:RNA 5'-triphosphatase [Schizosaccharomyces japonicus yFS275]|uniref:mRNA-capping enzyme subunit beta n=1 Tax=Schizosaccharomyces japonicus (strain yFS275 / FY16936) TaxID=402676 RepID=B6K6Y7_SCHJY|nr:RNA 5'-triphosphatase [Schizosaccharomyces japonicus yFS275]EEB09291.1 RNA 5'-triphosphatase [Schizosaccharomyces japonicus yFS275]